MRYICPSSPNHWDKNVPAVHIGIAQTSTKVTRQRLEIKMFVFDRKAHLFSSSYVSYGVKQSINRAALHFWHTILLFLFFVT